MIPFDFGHMLSVGAIHFSFQHSMPCTWRLGLIAVEWPWLPLSRTFLTSLAQTGIETIFHPLQGQYFWDCRQFSVWRSVHWLESSNQKFNNEQVWPRSCPPDDIQAEVERQTKDGIHRLQKTSS